MISHSSNRKSSPTTSHDGKVEPTISETARSAHQSPAKNSTHTNAGLGTIFILFVVVFVPVTAFSIVILWFVFHYRINLSTPPLPDLQGTPNENDNFYYYVNFPSARLLFIASWSSTIAPTVVGLIMMLSLFPISKKLFQISQSGNRQQLPTPYQFSVLLGLSGGTMAAMWKNIKYGFGKSRARRSSGLKLSAVIYTVALIISSMIVIVDTVLHITTTTVQITETTAVQSPNAALGKGVNAACANWTEADRDLGWYYPCTMREATTSAGLIYPEEVYRTINNISTSNQVLEIPSNSSTTGDLFILGPSASQRSPMSDYKATSVAITTSCKAISKLCNLQSTVGASTSFNCSTGWAGNLEEPNYSSPGLIYTNTYTANGEPENYTSQYNDFGLAVFTDSELTSGYVISKYNSNGTSSTFPTPNPFYLGVAALAQTDQSNNLSSDPEIVTGGHGGNGFVLQCEVTTYDVTYAYINGTVSPGSISSKQNNGTVGWNFLGPMSFQQERLAMMVDLAGVQNTSAELALAFGNQFSSLGTALLAGGYDGRTVLEQQNRDVLLVTKVLKGAIWALVLFNILLAAIGAGVAVSAFWVAMDGMGGTHAVVSVEQVVGMCFEGEKFGVNGDLVERFEENTVGEQSGRVGIVRKGEGWVLNRVNVGEDHEELIRRRS